MIISRFVSWSASTLHRFNASTNENSCFQNWRGDAKTGVFRDYATECTEGMVVLDAVHQIQRRKHAIWPVDGMQGRQVRVVFSRSKRDAELMCMTRLSELPLEKPVTIER